LNVRDAQKMILNISWRPGNCAAPGPDPWRHSHQPQGANHARFHRHNGNQRPYGLGRCGACCHPQSERHQQTYLCCNCGSLARLPRRISTGWVGRNRHAVPPHRLLRCRAAGSRLLALPIRLLIGLNIGRVLAVLFLLLAREGRLSGPFPFYAGWGDIITGVLAIPILLGRLESKHPAVVMAWNVFGAVDLVNAIFLGTISQEGSLQISEAPGSGAMQQLPWSFIPTVLVPYFLVAHGVIAVQLQSRRAPTHSHYEVT